MLDGKLKTCSLKILFENLSAYRTKTNAATLIMVKGGKNLSMDIEKAYDKLYRYVYFKVHNRETAEDITQETFLRYMGRYGNGKGYNMKLMYTIAKNLCVDEFRRSTPIPLPEEYELGQSSQHEDMLEKMIVDEALASLSAEEREMMLLRYVNDESVATIGELFRCSRFAAYRKLKGAIKKFQDFMEVKEHNE